jgi:hypothetical protein
VTVTATATRLELVTRLRVSVRTVDRLIADGLPAVSHRPTRYAVADARARLRGRQRTVSDEIGRALEGRIEDAREALEEAMRGKVPTGLVGDMHQEALAALREELDAWIPPTAAAIAARLAGEVDTIPTSMIWTVRQQRSSRIRCSWP